jgi:hypothetical protein
MGIDKFGVVGGPDYGEFNNLLSLGNRCWVMEFELS